MLRPYRALSNISDTAADEVSLALQRSFHGHSVLLLSALGRDGQNLLMTRHPELRAEIVESGRMTEKAFHDALIRLGSMPIALVRLVLGTQPLRPDMDLAWKCFGPDPGKD